MSISFENKLSNKIEFSIDSGSWNLMDEDIATTQFVDFFHKELLKTCLVRFSIKPIKTFLLTLSMWIVLHLLFSRTSCLGNSLSSLWPSSYAC